MTPILFEKDTRSFTGGGLCRLAEATAWSVKEVLNAEYELEMSYPADGEHFAEIKTERIILAKPNPTDEPQAFIIYAVSKPLRGRVMIYAEHVSHRQSKITVGPFHATSLSTALYAIKNASVNENPFTVTTNMNVVNEINSNIPRTLRNALYGRAISLYGGEIKYNNYSAEILARRGSNKGFAVRYGKNLLDFNQEEDVSAVYDAVYPYYFVQDLEDEEDFTYVELPEKIIKIGTTAEKIMPLNLTAEFSEEPDEEELREAAQKYLEQNDINKGVLSVTLNFAILSETEEHKNFLPPERVELGDDVAIFIPKRGVTVYSRIVKTVFDGKKGRFESVTVGEIETDIADTLVSIKSEVAGAQAKISATGKAIATLTLTADANKAQIDILTKWIEDNEGDVQNIAEINATAQKNKADIELLAKRTTEAETLIAQIDQEVDTERARIDLLAEFQTQTEKNIAEIETEANAQGAKIGLIVETNAAGENAVKGAILVEAINGQSTAKIAADRLDIEGKTLNIKVDAANITGTLTIGQLPDTVAEMGDIPTKTSQLTNDSGYAYTKDVPTETGITTIVKGVVTTDYVNALGITVNAANITGTLTAAQINTQGLKITDGELGGWDITAHYVKSTNEAVGLYSGEDDGLTLNTTDTSAIDGTKKSVRFFAGATNNTINTAPFRVLSDGSLYSTAGKFTNGLFDNCTINETCEIKGKLVGDALATNSVGNIQGSLSFFSPGYYEMKVDNGENTAGIQFGQRYDLNTPHVYIYSSYNEIEMNELEMSLYSAVTLNLTSNNGKLNGTWYYGSSPISTSDRNAKNAIQDIPNAYSAVFDALRPVIYKYNDGTSGRLHSGFIAQEIAEAVTGAGLTLNDFAAVCISDIGTEKERYGVRYEEIIALCVQEIQKLKARVCELERG